MKCIRVCSRSSLNFFLLFFNPFNRLFILLWRSCTLSYPGADLGGGCRGCAPPPPEMTCGFLIQLVFCKKRNYVVYWCWSRARDECTPLKKILDPPLISLSISLFTHMISTIGYITNSQWPALQLAWLAQWIERCVWSTQRSGFDSRSSLNFFRFFFNRFGCYFYCKDHTLFHYLR